MRKTLLAFLCVGASLVTIAQQAPKREMRGAWIATYSNIDWPNRTQTPAQQRAAFLSILEHHKATGLNTLFIQVRSQCDAMYASSIEPWSADLTGTQGKPPTEFWDPMQFMIDECHKRGIEFHAWLNPYRAAGNSNSLPSFSETHVAKQHPEWLLSQGTLRVLDPGLQPVREYILSVITDIVNRYDVDGIHFDDYFYPPAAPSGTTPYNDDASFANDPRGFTNRADWRRDNVNLLIKKVNDTILHLKPWVKFGVSPSGIYRNSTNPEIGTPTSGLEHYTTLYADTKKWLQQGWVDYIAPQVYWYIGQPGANYAAIVPWWNNQANGRHIYIGMAGYKVNDPAMGVNWANPSQIPNEMRLNRTFSNIYGQSIYNTSSMRSTARLGFRDSLRLFFYNLPVLQPRMPWRDSIAPAQPNALYVAKFRTDSVVLKWQQQPSSDELNRTRQYVIYRSTSEQIDTANAANILAITNADQAAFTDVSGEDGATYYYAVSALDRFHNESNASNSASNLPPAITCPDPQQLYTDSSCNITVPDYSALVRVNGQINAPGITVTQTPAAGTVINGHHNFDITFSAIDEASHKTECVFPIQLKDTIAPVISNAGVSTAELWPPNHKLKDVAVIYDAKDNCSTVQTSLSVTSNEPVAGGIYGNTSPDWVVVNDHLVQLRAEYGPFGNGRIYTITITATDSVGNSSQQQVQVKAPRFPENPNPHAMLTVKAYPNPTPDQFYVITLSTSLQTISYTVTDLAGKVIESKTGLSANGLFNIGSSYQPGMYILKVSQGQQSQTLKLVKTARK
ncbi:family 10 glycosylhydrolase [Pseudoflavitalea sp. G-6-1-2]|uniref:family 10 glycosylhydrolase n=1 Tax=Pseudoflavitalea sp. G-6-1-2 TaxID=2728841 RepID=UPI00146DB35C|nr:family 10 glycosylhydrolase [Pseudoflavitalea sp. G-6-1-2]NML20248.1 family 10 glycosylhydrolase [Pseudoflavitalea sp. G-6-1-2]